jgi:hypothetical protein
MIVCPLEHSRLCFSDGTIGLIRLLPPLRLASNQRGWVSSYTFNFYPEAAGQLWAAKDVLRPFQFGRTLPSTQIGLFILAKSNFIKPKKRREQKARCQGYHDPEKHGLNRSHRRPPAFSAKSDARVPACSACKSRESKVRHIKSAQLCDGSV